MSRNLLAPSVAACLLGGAALADVPRVAADIAPVHSLVARVMQGVGAPSLIVAPGGSPHEYNLRPSEAGALQEADVVFWVSPDLTPWLGGALESLAGDAVTVELLETDGTKELEMRENALFEAHDHGDDDHEDHDDHESHDDHHDEDHHDEGAAGHDDHGHGDHDPHAWLSPDNGAAWLDAIAATLAKVDPQNADAYRENAAAGRRELHTLKGEISATLDPVRGSNFIVFHDAYQYFETAFDIAASGAISLSDASDPSPSQIAAIQARVADQNVTCVLSEPQFNPGIVASVMDGSDARTGVLDPLGSGLEPGPDLYPRLLQNLAQALAGCL